MPNNTQELGLKLAVDNDDTADYLEIYLGNSLTTIDGLFSQVSGHTHSGAHQGGPINGNAFNGALDIPDWFRSTGHRSAYSTTGAGAEMYYDGTNAVFQGYDRGGSTYRPLLLRGSTLSIGPAAAPTAIDASGNVTLPAGLTATGLITGNGGLNTTALNCSGLGVSGSASVGGGLTAGPTSLSGDLQLNGHNINGLSTINGSPTISGNLQVNGYFNGGTTGSGTININTINTGGPVTVASTLTCNGQTNINGLSCTTINTNGNTITSGAITSSGQVQGTQLRATNGNLYINTRRVYDGGDGVHVDWDFRVDGAHDVFTHDIHIVASSGDCHISSASGQMDYYGPNGSTNHRFFHVDTSWMGCQAANFSVQSSVEHAIQYGKPILPIDNALEILDRLNPVHYFHMLMKGDQDEPLDDSHPGYFSYSMSAKQIAEVVPEAANGHFIDYDRLTPILWQAVKDLAARVRELEGATTA